MGMTDTSSALGAMGFSIPTEAEMREREQTAKNEVLAYIRSLWPEDVVDETAYIGDVYAQLQAVRQGRVCASCQEGKKPLCDGKRRVSSLMRKEYHGRPRYEACYRSCPLRAAKDASVTPFDRLFSHSRLTEKQRGQTFETFNREGVSRDVRRAYFMASGAVEDGSWLALCGQRGTGKSHLAAAIALETMRRGQQAYFRLVSEMLDDLRQGYDDGDYDAQMKFLKEVPCLVLDDLGKERSTDAAKDFLYQIIDARYRERRQVIITSNAKSKEELTGLKDVSFLAPLISRMDEMGDWVFIAGAEDYRTRLGRERRANAKKEAA